MTVGVRFLGTGNAFGDGGRGQACIHVTAPGASLVLDFGASALTAFKAAGVALHTIDAIAVTHLHGDHFGGIPFLILEQHFRGRTAPLTIAGPAGLERRVRAALGALFADFVADHTIAFPLRFVTLGPDPVALGGGQVSAHAVEHVPLAEPHGLRVAIGGKLVAYSGDCVWSDALAALARGADLFICEASSFATADPVHLTYRELAAHRAELDCKRIVLTHLGADALAHRSEIALECASDGDAITL